MVVHNSLQFKTLCKWILISCIIGPVTAITVKGFLYVLPVVSTVVEKAFSFSPYLLPIAGGLVCGLFILKSAPGAGGEGIPSYLIAVNRDRGMMSLRDTILKIPATIITLGFFGSGGIVGPLSRIGAGIGCHLTRWFFRLLCMDETGLLRTATICGASGIVSSIFHSPLVGAVFAVEILSSDTLKYSDLFPSILTGCMAYMTSAFLLGEGAIFQITTPPAPEGGMIHFLLPVMAVIGGTMGILLIIIYEKSVDIFGKIPLGQPVKAGLAGAILTMLWLGGLRWILGTSSSLFSSLASADHMTLEASFPGGVNLPLLLFIIIFMKILSTSVTVGSGMSGGFTGPMLIIGLAGGALVSSLAGIDPGSPAYYLLAACSVSATLCATLNIPLAAILISSSLFGIDYLLPACIGSIISFIIFKNRTIYEYSITLQSANIDHKHTASQA
ncbi:MAG: chloride channel protein [Bacteroidales bacterium]|nr:chloride channel protein [Candidatus Latescibacterota bacterium]